MYMYALHYHLDLMALLILQKSMEVFFERDSVNMMASSIPKCVCAILAIFQKKTFFACPCLD